MHHTEKNTDGLTICGLSHPQMMSSFVGGYNKPWYSLRNSKILRVPRPKHFNSRKIRFIRSNGQIGPIPSGLVTCINIF
jgi:hypothetical protein